MDREQCITLVERLEAVPDPRDARGKRYEWRVILAILCAGLISGQKMVWGIVDWACDHGREIIDLLEIRKRRIPRASTFCWVLRHVGVVTWKPSALLNDYVCWPGAQQVLRRTYHVVDLRTGAVWHKVTYGITSLSRQRALPKQVEALWRSHWTIENCDH